VSDPLRYVAPRTPTEEVLAQIWAEVLKLEQVGVEENFFDLGGTSLSVMRIPPRVKRSLGRDLKITDLFTYPTVSELARSLDGQRAARVDSNKIRASLQRRRMQPKLRRSGDLMASPSGWLHKE